MANVRKRVLVIVVVAIMLAIGLTYITIGVFVIQPMGALPEGATVLYWRVSTNLPFISSADGLLLDTGSEVSLLGRAIVMGTIGSIVVERKIGSFPYSRTFYLLSTKGKEFEKKH